MTPLCITGLGIVSTLGIGREAFFQAMHSPPLLAQEPVYPVETFDASAYSNAALAEVRGFDPTYYLGEKGLRTLDRLTKLLIVATRLALHDAGLKKDGAYIQLGPNHVGICASNAYGSLEAVAELERVVTLEDARYINPSKFPNTVSNTAAGYASIWEDLRALNVSVSDGNCGALDAVACAGMFLETGRAEALLVGGAESMSEPLYLAFYKLGATDARTRLGEGAALLTLETHETCAGRGAQSLGEVIGYGTAFVPPEADPLLIYASHEAVERAILSALEDAGINSSLIDLICSGVSGIKAFDQAELAAIARVFGSDICVTAPKALLGETLGAGGGMAMAAVLAWFAGTCPSAVVSGKPPARIRHVLVTSMGFYGNASAIVMRKVDLE